MSISDFEIIKELGKGAFSTVSLVKRRQDNKIYALKCVQISKLSTHERQNSLNEVRLLASINHKNIISYKESFYNENNKTLNIILEYADDGDLQTKIISKKNSDNIFEEKTIWSIFIQMVKGLNELHNKKIVHRDLKSANIFLMKNGICKLGDLNVAKVAENGLLRTQTGTPFFASPEIWEDKPYSFKSDIWSIGCILYQMAALKMPFQGKNIKEVYYNLKNVNIPPLPENYSKELMIMIKKMLRLKPEQRPSTQEILDDEIIKSKMKKLFENDNDLIDISMDINNFKKIKNNNKNNGLIRSIKINNDKNLNYILPKKNYDDKDNLFFDKKENIFYKEIGKEKEIPIIFKDRNINYKFYNIINENKKTLSQNYSFCEENSYDKNKHNENKFSLNNCDKKNLHKISKTEKNLININRKKIRRQCNSAKIEKNNILNNKEENKNIQKDINTENKYQYKRITPKNVDRNINYNKNNNYNHLSDYSFSDKKIKKNYGTAEGSLINNDSLNKKYNKKNKINDLKRVNSLLLRDKNMINQQKRNIINKNNSLYSFPLLNNNEFKNQNKEINLEQKLNEDNKILKDKNKNITLEINYDIKEIKDFYNVNSCRNEKKNFKENTLNYRNNHNTEKRKKLIPTRPIKYGIPTFGKNELNKNQNYYQKSHSNLDKHSNDIMSEEKYRNNNIIKKLFPLSPRNQIYDKITIENNNICTNNNYNIKKKYPFILNFNQKEKNSSLENANNNIKNEINELIPKLYNNININKKEIILPKLPHIKTICLSNKKNNDDELNNKNNRIENKENAIGIEPIKKKLIDPIKIIAKKESKIKLLPIDLQIRINKLNDINNNAYK